MKDPFRNLHGAIVLTEILTLGLCSSLIDELIIPDDSYQILGFPCNPNDPNTCSPADIYMCGETVSLTSEPSPACICRNSTTHIANWASGECLLKATHLGDGCDTDLQCSSTFGSFSKCSAKPGGKCVCTGNYSPNKNSTKCLSKIGSSCTTSSDCLGFPGSTFCSAVTRLCSCFPGNVTNSRKDGCLPVRYKIGDECEEEIQCRVSGSKAHLSICVDSKCNCSSNAVSERGQHVCYEKANHVLDRCEISIQCETQLGRDSVCSEDHLCTCSNGTVPLDKLTRCGSGPVLIGWPCRNQSCAGAEGTSECTYSGYCGCSQGHVASASLDDCLPVRNQLGEECSQPQQCQQGATGGDSDCTEDSSGKKVCQCKKGFVNEPGSHKCHKIATRVGSKCEVHMQCLVGIGSSQCVDKACQCTLGNDGVKPPPENVEFTTSYVSSPASSQIFQLRCRNY